MKETWKQIKDYPFYSVSDKGRIKSRKRKHTRILKGTITKFGYIRMCLTNDEGEKFIYIHRLVLETFKEKCPGEKQACHNNNNPANNQIKNLRWDTSLNNHADRKKHGTLNLGVQNGNNKLTVKQILEIKKDFRTQNEIAKTYKTHQTNISCIKSGITWAWLKD